MNFRSMMWTLMLVALGVMAWSYYTQKQEAAKTSQAPAPTAGNNARGPAGSPATSSGPASTQPALEFRQHPVEGAALGSIDQQTGYKMHVELTNYAAAVQKLELSEFFTTVQDKRRYEKDRAAYLKDYKERGGNFVLVRAVEGYDSLLKSPVKYYPMASWLSFGFKPNSQETPAFSAPPIWKALPVQPVKEGDKDVGESITFTTTVTKAGWPYLTVEKTYTLRKGSYNLEVEFQLRNETGQSTATQLAVPEDIKDFGLVQFGPTGIPSEDVQADKRVFVYGFKQRTGDKIEVVVASVLETKDIHRGLPWYGPKKDEKPDEAGVWAGCSDKFFASVLYAVPALDDKDVYARKARYWKAAAADDQYLAGANLGGWDIPAGKALDDKIKLVLFAGPKSRPLFEANELYAKLNFKDIEPPGWCTWQWLSSALMWVLDIFYKVTRNYGLAIMLLVVIVRVLLHPLTKKSQVSMMKMQKLQPEMNKLKEKYADDKAKQNAEMMKLYKDAGSTPVMGCLPMILQMPIWIALWTGIQTNVELRQAAFLPVWITDLAAPDMLINFHTTINIPLIGSMMGPITGFNLLPILLAVAMAIQQKMMPSPQAAAGDPQAKAQKSMMYFMTIFMLLIFYNQPSGLTLYIMASTFAGVIEQKVIRKHIKDREAAEAASETRVEMPGKYFRGQKPKKLKGPFRMK